MKIFLRLIIVLLISCSLPDETHPDHQSLDILFWNLENMFDCTDDSLTEDDEFTPFGDRHWNSFKYYRKVNRIWKIILAAGNGQPPAIIAVSEVENRKVLEDIFIRSPFGDFEYEIIHRDSPDRRGIDVALVYDPNKLVLLNSRFHSFDTLKSNGRKSRDILEAHFRAGPDSLIVFVNHWPSKYGGAGYSEKFRQIAAEMLRGRIDSLLKCDSAANIICTGDFNDPVDAESISGILLKSDEGENPCLLPVTLKTRKGRGTIRYRGNWETIDHFFVSENIFFRQQNFSHEEPCGFVFSPGYLLEPDETYGGKKPFRTWTGYVYNDGISDHLPVMFEFIL